MDVQKQREIARKGGEESARSQERDDQGQFAGTGGQGGQGSGGGNQGGQGGR